MAEHSFHNSKLKNSKLFNRLQQLLSNKAAAALLLFTFASLLYLSLIMREQVSYQEGVLFRLIDLQWSEMFNLFRSGPADLQPPLYYIIIKTLSLVTGRSLLAFRIVSALSAALLLVVFYCFSLVLLTKRGTLAALLLLVVNPLILAYAREASPMMITILLCVFFLAFYYRALTRPNMFVYILFFLSGVAGIFTSYYFIPLLVSVIIFTGFFFLYKRNDEHPNKRNMLVTTGLLLVMTGLLLFRTPALINHFRVLPVETWSLPWHRGTFIDILSFFFSTKFGNDVHPFIPSSFAALVVIVFVLYGFYYHYRENTLTFKHYFLLGMYLIPFLVVTIISLVYEGIVNYQMFLALMPIILILYGIGIEVVKRRYLQMIYSAALVLILAPTFYIQYTDNFNGSSGDTSEYISSNRDKSGTIITLDPVSWLTLSEYLTDKESVFLFTIGHPSLPDPVIPNDRLLYENSSNPHLDTQDSLWLIMTPQTKELARNFMKLNNFEVDPGEKQEILQFEHSRLRHKVLLLRRLANST
jgi:hypothetical protein